MDTNIYFDSTNNNTFSTLMDSLYDGVYCTDCDRKITFWNKAAEELTGFSREEVVGHCCRDQVLQHVSENGCNLCESNCPLQQSIINGHKIESFAYLHHKDGHRLPVYIRTSPLFSNNEIIGGIEIFSNASMVISLRMTNKRLKDMAFLDELTNLPNRRYGMQKLDDALYNFNRYQHNFGVAIFDIDHFKKVNDTYGHDTGDMALKMVAQSLQFGARETDFVCRWGGEEFICIIQNADVETLKTVTERQRQLVENSFLNCEKAEDSILRVTISGGAALYTAQNDASGIVNLADNALYDSKENGRNRVTIHNTTT